MPQNPFTVVPGGDYSQGLRGLSDVVGEIGERKRKEESEQKAIEKFATMKAGAMEAYRSGDPDTIAEFSLQNPEMSQALSQSMGFKNKQTEQNYQDSLFDFYQNPTEENVNGLVESRQELLRGQGVGPEGSQETDQFIQRFMENPENVHKEIGAELAFRYPKKWKSMQGDTTTGKPTSTIQEYNLAKGQGYAGSFIEYKKEFGKGTTTTGKTYSKKNPDGSTRTIKNVKPGSDQESQLLEAQFVEGSQTVGAKLSGKERKQERINKATDKLSKMANEDPNKFYSEHRYRQNEDGSLFIDPVSGGPQELRSFEQVTGKRGNMKAIMELGEQWDDSKELLELLELPSVQKDLKKAKSDGLWDKVAGKWNNKIQKWMQDSGIKGDSPTATAIARTQRMASDERKRFMGTAVTENEQISSLAWMPSAGDSYESMINKTTLMSQESEQMFRRYMSVMEGAGADMSPFSDAFGIKKFDVKEQQSSEKTDEELMESLGL